MLLMPLIPIYSWASLQEGTLQHLNYELNHKTLSTLEMPWQDQLFHCLLFLSFGKTTKHCYYFVFNNSACANCSFLIAKRLSSL
jgi:hypothetical protein